MLEGCGQLAEGLVVAVGDEDGVVAEAALAAVLEGQAAFHGATEGVGLALGGHQGEDTHEAGGPVGTLGQHGQEAAVLGGVVRQVRGEAGAEHAGAAPEGVHTEARIIGQGAVHGLAPLLPPPGQGAFGLLQGVVLEEGAGLRQLRRFRRPEHKVELRQQRRELPELAGIAGGEEQLQHRHPPRKEKEKRATDFRDSHRLERQELGVFHLCNL